MRSDSSQLPQRGFSLVPVIFLITAVASLAGYMVTIAGTQQATSTLSYLSAQNYFAAQSGLEWAINRAVVQPADLGCGGAGASFGLTQSGLTDYTVSVSCTASTISEAATSYVVYNLNVTASRGAFGTMDFASRSLQATVTQPN